MGNDIEKAITAIVLLAGPLFLNWYEFGGHYFLTACFASFALVTLYQSITAVGDTTLKVHKMVWPLAHPGEPWS